jgi:hypothetical protein
VFCEEPEIMQSTPVLQFEPEFVRRSTFFGDRPLPASVTLHGIPSVQIGAGSKFPGFTIVKLQENASLSFPAESTTNPAGTLTVKVDALLRLVPSVVNVKLAILTPIVASFQ